MQHLLASPSFLCARHSPRQAWALHSLTKTLITLTLLTLCTKVQGQLRHYGCKEGLTTGEVTQVVEIPNGQILVNTVGSFCLFDGETFVPVPCHTDSLLKLQGFGNYGYLWQGDSLLWLHDFYYLYLFDAIERRFRYDTRERLREMPDAGKVLKGKAGNGHTSVAGWQDTLKKYGVGTDCPVNVVCHDRHRGAWIGTQGQNLFYLPPRAPYAHTVPCPGGKAAQVLANAGGDTLLLGTEDGLWLLNAVTGHTRLLKREEKALYHSATTDRNGRIWICSQHGIDCYMDGQTVRYDSKNINGFVHDHVYFVRQMADGRLLTNNDHRVLGMLDVEKMRFEPLAKCLPDLRQYRVIIDALPLDNGRHVLALTQNGAFVLDLKTQRTAPLTHLPVGMSDKFNCAWQDETGNLWLGTQDGLGITTAADKPLRLTMPGCIRGLAGDGQGHLWVRCSDGLIRINAEQIQDRNKEETMARNIRLAATDGIPVAGLQERSLVLTPGGLLCMANACGVTVVDTRNFRTPPDPLPAILTGITTSRRRLPLHCTSWTLNHGEDRLEIVFSALYHPAPSHTHYRYRLRGLDEKWTYTEAGRALFTTLPPGHYTFEAQAAVFDGEWGPVLQRDVIMRPPFWRTWWAYTFYALVLTMAAVGTAIWYRRRTRAALEAMNDERVNRLFLLREEARHRFAQNVRVTAKEIAADSREEELMERVMEAVGRNIGNSEYTVDMLADDVCMSRASLYRNMRNILGITPNDFIRNTRLKQAARMLEETELSVNEISVRVGFGSSRYFATQFRKLFGVLPSEYRSPDSERKKG